MQNLLRKFKTHVCSLMTIRNEARHMFIKMTDVSNSVSLFHTSIQILFITTSTEMVFFNFGKVLGLEQVKLEIHTMTL